jgi:hypothetical protein
MKQHDLHHMMAITLIVRMRQKSAYLMAGLTRQREAPPRAGAARGTQEERRGEVGHGRRASRS